MLDIVSRHQMRNVRVECLPAILHNSPERIPDAVQKKLEQSKGYDSVFVAYADCGTGGKLDEVLNRYGVQRLEGAHCYEFYSGSDAFHAMQEEELGTLYLTDFLARHFDRFIWKGLGLDRWPELRDDYFGNYRRVVYLAQTDDPVRTEEAKRAAEKLELEFERRNVGYGEMEPAFVEVSTRAKVSA